MPYIGGGNLQSILRRRGPLPLEDATRYLEQICAALDYAHARNVAHLDLKPLNLLAHEDGRLLLSDFGLAHLMEQGAIEGSTSLQFGTPAYMAPEHLQGQPERRSDIYALGIINFGRGSSPSRLRDGEEPRPPFACRFRLGEKEALGMQQKRAYQYRWYPTPSQRQMLARTDLLCAFRL